MFGMDLVAIAVIKRAIGLDGYCGVLPYGETFERMKAPAAIYIGDNERRVRETVLEKVSLRPQGYAALFSIAHDRTEAEKLSGLCIYVQEDRLPPLDDGQYYHFRLSGMTVVAESSGVPIGVVKDTVKLPSTDALEIILPDGREIIVPYNEQAVVKVDTEAKKIVVCNSYIEELL